MVRKRRTQAERSADTRARLLEASAELLAQKGYVGFRVDEVSKLAAASRGAQTHHFPTKDGLVLAAVQHAFDVSERESEARFARLKAGSDLVDALVEDGAAYYLGRAFAIALNLVSVGDQASPFRQQIITSSRSHRLRVEQRWLELLLASGASKARAEEALWVTNDVLRGMAVRRFIVDSAALRRRRIARLRELVRMLLHGES